MKSTFFVTFILAAGCASTASAQTYVQPYVRSDGTFVQGHYRSEANSSRSDNYSSRGNYNPYTGSRGTVDPYKQSYQQPAYRAPTYQPIYQAPRRRSVYGN